MPLLPVEGMTMVEKIRLDSILEVSDRLSAGFNVLKCDAEGHDLEVLLGAERLLKDRSRSWIVLVEVGEAGLEIGSYLARIGLEPIRLCGDGERVERRPGLTRSRNAMFTNAWDDLHRRVVRDC